MKLREINGMSALAPTQIWNAPINNTTLASVGTKVINEVAFPTNYYGYASITLIPTGNPLYAPEYNYLQVSKVIGNYSIELGGEEFDGEPFVFVVGGKVTNVYPLEVLNYYKYENITSNNLPNLNSFVSVAMNTIYTIFAKFWKVVAG